MEFGYASIEDVPGSFYHIPGHAIGRGISLDSGVFIIYSRSAIETSKAFEERIISIWNFHTQKPPIFFNLIFDRKEGKKVNLLKIMALAFGHVEGMISIRSSMVQVFREFSRLSLEYRRHVMNCRF